MKQLSFIGLLVALFLISGCKKEKDQDKDDDDIVGTPVMISGEVDMSATSVARVLALSSTNTHKLVDVVNNHFSIELDNGKPWGLVFLDNASQPLGVLSMGNGIDALPLHYISAGVSAIDLLVITRNGNVFTPAHNPLGSEIQLTSQQMIAVASMDDYLVAVLKNPDVNGNGQIDLLEGKFFKLSVIYFIKPGTFSGAALTPSIDTNTLIEGYKLFLTAEDQSFPETVYFTGPGGSQLSNTGSEGYLSFTDNRVYSTPYQYNLMGTGSYIPPGGTYTIQYGGSTLTFNLADQSYVNNNIVYPWPTLALNSNGTMNSMSWVYRILSGTVNFDISALMRGLEIQIEGEGNKCSSHQNSDRLYDSGKLPVSTTAHTFSCQNIDWGTGAPYPGWKHIDRVMMTYEDHYDASYVVMYEKY